MALANRAGLKNTRTLLRAFGGLNETYSCTEAECSSGKNFSARNFPALSTRIPRRKLRTAAPVNGMYHLNGLLVVEGTNLCYSTDDAPQTVQTVENAVTDSKKVLVGMGTKIIIFPDKAAFDTKDLSVTPLAAAWTNGNADVVLTPCDAAGKTYTVKNRGPKEPTDPADGDLFLKVVNSQVPYSSESILEIYSEASGNWSAIELNWCRIECKGIGADFAVWDTVTLSGIKDDDGGYWKGLKGDRIVYARGEDWVQVRAEPGGDYFYGTLTKSGDVIRWKSIDGKGSGLEGSPDPFRLERRVPDLDYLTECDNRLWGCSKAENAIYGCKLGDPTNWFSYRGIAEDSYAVTVGSDGDFTGASTCLGYVLFFKENCIHKLYGSKPSDYQLSSVRCRGVAANAAHSLCVLNETLYYLSPGGVMAWDGSLPSKVSGALDTGKLTGAAWCAAGSLDARYYLYLRRQGDSAGRLLVYDTERGLWHEESAVGYEMASTGRQLYLWDGRALWAADPDRETEGEAEAALQFEAVSGDIGLTETDDKYISRITLRLDAQTHSVVTLAVSYDGGPWETLRTAAATGDHARLNLPFEPRRHDTLRLKLSGTGQIALRSVAFTLAGTTGGRVTGAGPRK